MLISSRQNPMIKQYRKLCGSRRDRKEQGYFPCEGIKLVSEALKSEVTLGENAFITESAAAKYPDIFEKLSLKCNLYTVTEDISEYISDTKSPQGVFITVKSLDKILILSTIYNSRSFILLDNLQDMGNIGTIIRTCDAFGIDGIIASPDTADIFSAKVSRSTMGSVFRVPVYISDLTQAISLLKEGGFTVYSAELNRSAETLGGFAFPEKSAVVIGNEGNGVSGEISAACDKSLFIPMNTAESLNAAVAASIIAWEMQKSL